MTIATLTKLLLIRIVANSLLGVSSNVKINLFTRVDLASMSFNSFGLSEKNATSEPEIKAEKNNRMTIINKLIKTPRVKCPEKMLTSIPRNHKWGSLSGSSKIQLFNATKFQLQN